MTEDQYQALKNKIDKEWPVRCDLASLAGHKVNPKNSRCLMDTEYDLDIKEFYLYFLFKKPANAHIALQIIQNFYK
jgi:hypothetical protein